MGLFERITNAGGIDYVARCAGVGRAVITKMIRGEAVDAKLADKVLAHLDADEKPTATVTNNNTLIAREESRGRRAWS